MAKSSVFKFTEDEPPRRLSISLSNMCRNPIKFHYLYISFDGLLNSQRLCEEFEQSPVNISSRVARAMNGCIENKTREAGHGRWGKVANGRFVEPNFSRIGIRRLAAPEKADWLQRVYCVEKLGFFGGLKLSEMSGSCESSSRSQIGVCLFLNCP